MNDNIVINSDVSINKEQRLYVLKCGGYSCLGFDVVDKKIKNLCEALNIDNTCKNKGTKKAYLFYRALMATAEKTGKRFDFELYKPFIGNEGKRVEITYTWGDKERGIIGKSTGWIPCHILLKRCDSSGGGSVLADSIKSWKFI